MASSRRTGVNEQVYSYGGAGDDYSTLSAWESDTDLNLTSILASKVLECNAGTYAETVNISGSTTSASYCRIIRPKPGHAHLGVLGAGVKFTASSTLSLQIFGINEYDFKLQDVECSFTVNTSGTANAVYVNGSSRIELVGLIVSANNLYSGKACGGINKSTSGTVFIINSIIWNTDGDGIFTAYSGLTVYNCSVGNIGDSGYDNNAGSSVVAKNCVAGTCATADFEGLWTQTNSIVSPTYTNESSGDLTLTPASSGVNEGGDLSSDLSFPFDDDITFGTRGGVTAWDCGAFEIFPITCTRTASIDALIANAGITRTASFDARLQKSMAAAASLDALAQRAGATAGSSLDALAQRAGVSVSALTDALLQKAGVTTGSSLDGLIKASLSVGVSPDALLQKALSVFAGMDAVIAPGHGAAITNIDALLQGLHTVVLAADALLQAGISAEADLDALFQKALSESVGLDSYLMMGGSAASSLDAYLQKAFGATTHADAYLSSVRSSMTGLDGALQHTGIVTTQIGGLIAAVYARTASIEAFLAREVLLGLSLDAAVVSTKANAASLSAFILDPDFVCAYRDHVDAVSMVKGIDAEPIVKGIDAEPIIKGIDADPTYH